MTSDALLVYAGLAVLAMIVGAFASILNNTLKRIAAALEVLADKARHP